MLDIRRVKIGDTFTSEHGLWQITDVGSRVVVAVRLEAGEHAHGPPYATKEVVFDEHDFGTCHVDHGRDHEVDLGLSSDQSTMGDFVPDDDHHGDRPAVEFTLDDSDVDPNDFIELR